VIGFGVRVREERLSWVSFRVRILNIGGDGALGYGDEVLIKWVEIYGIGVFIEGGWKIGLVWVCVIRFKEWWLLNMSWLTSGTVRPMFLFSFSTLQGLISVLLLIE
jgi:hypothetical protein